MPTTMLKWFFMSWYSVPNFPYFAKINNRSFLFQDEGIVIQLDRREDSLLTDAYLFSMAIEQSYFSSINIMAIQRNELLVVTWHMISVTFSALFLYRFLY